MFTLGYFLFSFQIVLTSLPYLWLQLDAVFYHNLGSCSYGRMNTGHAVTRRDRCVSSGTRHGQVSLLLHGLLVFCRHNCGAGLEPRVLTFSEDLSRLLVLCRERTETAKSGAALPAHQSNLLKFNLLNLGCDSDRFNKMIMSRKKNRQIRGLA